MDNIVRTPIIIEYNRRNEYNPEFLDLDFLISKYTPLFKSICRYFCSYAGILDKPNDIEDLYSQIQLEFLKLVKRYDPRRGVDFPGYIKLNLQNRVYYWVTRLQKLQTTERLLFWSEENNEESDMEIDLYYMNKQYYNLTDPSNEQEKFKIESLMSIPWEELKDESDREMVIDILNHMSLEDIARKRHTLITSIREQFDKICNLLITVHNRNAGEIKCSENPIIENSGN